MTQRVMTCVHNHDSRTTLTLPVSPDVTSPCTPAPLTPYSTSPCPSPSPRCAKTEGQSQGSGGGGLTPKGEGEGGRVGPHVTREMTMHKGVGTVDRCGVLDSVQYILYSDFYHKCVNNTFLWYMMVELCKSSLIT
jgi:hypothetical protein